jgi:hypothetical protein
MTARLTGPVILDFFGEQACVVTSGFGASSLTDNDEFE